MCGKTGKSRSKEEGAPGGKECFKERMGTMATQWLHLAASRTEDREGIAQQHR